MSYDSLEHYFRVPYADISQRWQWGEDGAAPSPWQQPPQCGAAILERLLVLTVGGHIFEVPWQEFYRIMRRDNLMKLVFERGGEEIILEFYGSEQPRSTTVKEPFNWLKKFIPEPENDEKPSNVIPFRKPVL